MPTAIPTEEAEQPHEDLYPTRLTSRLPPFARRCPVIHGDDEQHLAGPLDAEHLDRFNKDGFIWLEGFLSPENIAPFFGELAAMENDSQLTANDQVITDPESGAIRSVFAMHKLSKRFDALTRHPYLLAIVRQLLGSDVYIHQSRINDKGGFQGSGFDWHSDFETWHAEDGMPRMRAVSASLMLTDNLEFNGPLMLVPGSHRHFIPTLGKTPDDHWQCSLKHQRIGVPDQEPLRELIEHRGIVAPKGPAGSLLLFDCNTLHASNRNMSPWPRSNLFFVYNSVDNAPEAPYGGTRPRPEFLAARQTIDILR